MNSNYQNAKIYKIVDNTTDMIYIGSTCKTLEQRLKQHKANFKCFINGKYHHITAFKILENRDFKIELLKLFPCTNKNELESEEGKATLKLKNEGLNIINRNIAGRTETDYYQDKKCIISEKHKVKYNCICGSFLRKSDKSQHEKSKKHQNYIDNSKTINIETLNITININNPEDLNKLDILNIVK